MSFVENIRFIDRLRSFLTGSFGGANRLLSISEIAIATNIDLSYSTYFPGLSNPPLCKNIYDRIFRTKTATLPDGSEAGSGDGRHDAIESRCKRERYLKRGALPLFDPPYDICS